MLACLQSSLLMHCVDILISRPIRGGEVGTMCCKNSTSPNLTPPYEADLMLSRVDSSQPILLSSPDEPTFFRPILHASTDHFLELPTLSFLSVLSPMGPLPEHRLLALEVHQTNRASHRTRSSRGRYQRSTFTQCVPKRKPSLSQSKRQPRSWVSI